MLPVTLTLLTFTMTLTCITQVRATEELVEGCFSTILNPVEHIMYYNPSNGNCQEHCRKHGFAVAAIRKTDSKVRCSCTLSYPVYMKPDSTCLEKCSSWQSCGRVQSCCGGKTNYAGSTVGDVDTAKVIGKRIASGWQKHKEFYRQTMTLAGLKQAQFDETTETSQAFIYSMKGSQEKFAALQKMWNLAEPEIQFVMRNVKGQIVQCTADASDTSDLLNSFKCTAAKTATQDVTLYKEKMQIFDQSPASVQKEEIVGDVVKCPANNYAYTCSKSTTVTFKKGTSLTVGTGSTMDTEISAGFTVGVSSTVGVSAGIVSAETTASVEASLGTAVAFGSSMSRQSGSYSDKTVSHQFKVTIPVTATKGATILFKRSKQDYVFKWVAHLQVLGFFHLTWHKGTEKEVTMRFSLGTILATEAEYKFVAFGKWKYPNKDTLTVQVTRDGMAPTKCGDNVNVDKDKTGTSAQTC